MSEKPDEWARKCREAVELRLGAEKVEAVGEFERPQKFWASSDSFLVREFARGLAKDQGRLDDLPERFLLAVTRDKVYAFDYRKRRSQLELKEKVADFDRNTLSFSKEMGTWAEVAVLELTEEGRNTRIQVKGDVLNAKKNPWAAEVLAALMK
jgi:hypothetical protein